MSGIRSLAEEIAVFTDKEEFLQSLPRFYDTTDEPLNQLVQSLSNELILFKDSVKYDLVKQLNCENAGSMGLDSSLEQLNIGRISWYDGSDWQSESDNHYETRALKFSTYGGNLYTTEFLAILLNDVITASGLTNTENPEIIIDDFPSITIKYNGDYDYGDSGIYYMSNDTVYGYMVEVVIGDAAVFDYIDSNNNGIYFIHEYIDKLIKRILPVGHNYQINFYCSNGVDTEEQSRVSTISNADNWGDELDTPPGIFIHTVKQLINGNTHIDHSADFPDPAHWVWSIWRTYLEA